MKQGHLFLLFLFCSRFLAGFALLSRARPWLLAASSSACLTGACADAPLLYIISVYRYIDTEGPGGVKLYCSTAVLLFFFMIFKN